MTDRPLWTDMPSSGPERLFGRDFIRPSGIQVRREGEAAFMEFGMWPREDYEFDVITFSCGCRGFRPSQYPDAEWRPLLCKGHIQP